jgi:hypothetical protein
MTDEMRPTAEIGQITGLITDALEDVDSAEELSRAIAIAAVKIQALYTRPSPNAERVREALDRQCDNMAFLLNNAALNVTWYEKFKGELAQDRAALTRPEGEG